MLKKKEVKKKYGYKERDNWRKTFRKNNKEMAEDRWTFQRKKCVRKSTTERISKIYALKEWTDERK